MKRNIPAVGYVRMSSGKQEASPAQQRAEIEKLARQHGCIIIRWYSDEAISGDATDKRKEFQRMIQDAEQIKDFKVILCWDQDRFGRFDSLEAGRWIHPLREAGVRLITAAQGAIDWNDFTGRMMFSIQQEAKHQYLVDLSRNVSRGRIASAKKGQLIGNPPCGYDRVFFDAAGGEVKRVPFGTNFSRPKDWTVQLSPAEDTEQVEAVVWLFEQYAHGDHSLRSLVRDLNGRGIKTRRGGSWNAVSVRHILSHPVYIGHLVFGRRRSGKYHQVSKGGDLQKGAGKGWRDDAPIIVEDTHQALVSRETFEAVQRKLAERGERGIKPRYNGYILSGILRCGHCGRPMCGKSTGSAKNGTKRRYYYCPGIANGLCSAHNIRQEQIDTYTLDVLNKRLFTPRAVERIKKAIHQRVKSQAGFKDTVKVTKGKIAAMDKKITKGTENLLLADPDNMADLSDLLATWKRERAQLQGELEAMITSASGTTEAERAERAIAELKQLREHFRSADPGVVKGVVSAMIDDIKVWWEPNGSRYHRVSKGLLTLRSNDRVLQCNTGRTGPLATISSASADGRTFSATSSAGCSSSPST